MTVGIDPVDTVLVDTAVVGWMCSWMAPTSVIVEILSLTSQRIP